MGEGHRYPSPPRFPKPLSFSRVLIGLGLALVMVATAALSSWAQGEEPATVVVDGRPLFEVVAFPPLTAQERADRVNDQLAELIESPSTIRVLTESRNDAPTLVINGAYLLTVTQQDADLGHNDTPQAQAKEWAAILQQSLTQAQQERTQTFLLKATMLAGVVIVFAISLSWFLGRLWEKTLRRLITTLTFSNTESAQTQTTGLNVTLSSSLFLVRLVIGLGTVIYVTNLFPITRQWSYSIINASTQGFIARSFTLGDRAFSILDLLVLMGLLLGLVLLAGTVTNVLRSRILHITGINRGAQEAVAVLTKYSLIFVGTVVLLQVWGLDLSSLTLLASALGVGVGLGLQNIAKDFGSGFILVFERPIQVGDFVEFGAFMGTVERIGARSTEIKTLDQVSIIVPNSRFLEQEVINWSHRNPVSRIRLPVGVAYAANPEQVRQTLLEVGRSHPSVLSTPPPQVFFVGFGDSALNFELLIWIAEPSKQWLIKSDLYFAIESALRQREIEIPFPQQDLHIRSGSVPLELSDELRQWLTQLSQGHSNGNRL